MQEHSPHISDEVRTRLSQYLDDELDDAAREQVETLISADPAVKEEYARLRILHSAVQSASEKSLHYNRVTDSLWNKISTQLEADQKQSPEVFDHLFISTYYDGEIPSGDPVLERFESQLYNNMEANRMLASIGEVSEAIRQFGYRLEESCTLDITRRVMDAYLEEANGQNLETISVSSEVEMLSAYVDQELSAKETIETNRLVEGNPAHQQTIRVFTRLSEAIQDISGQLQEQAPDVWPAVEKELSSNVVAMPERKKGQLVSLRQFVMTTGVAAILLLVAVPIFQGLESPAPLSPARTKELASVPANSANYMRVNFQDMSAPSAGAPAPQDAVEPSSDDILVTLSKSDMERYNPQDVPSAEEFLFSEMEQTNSESGQVIVGQE